MSSFAAFPNLKSPGAGLLLFLVTLIAAPYTLGDGDGSSSGGDPNTSGGDDRDDPIDVDPVPIPHGTPTMVGYSSTAEGETSPSNYRAHFTSLGSQKIYVIPFRFDSLGDYTLTSANLLLSTPLGLPSQPSFATPSLSDVSLQVFSSLPSSLSLPTPITSFASLDIATTTVGVHTFAATSSPTLTASTTYYLGLTYLGDDPLSWNYYEEVPSLGPKLSNPVSDTFNSRTAFIYYAIGSEGVTQDTAVLGGFSITAAAVNAIPEPATTVAFAAGAVLAAAMWVRWRRTARSRE